MGLPGNNGIVLWGLVGNKGIVIWGYQGITELFYGG